MTWKLLDDPYYRRAETSGRSYAATVELQDDGWLTIDAEQGSGYMREHITTRVPGEIMLWLLQPAMGLIGMAESIRNRPRELVRLFDPAPPGPCPICGPVCNGH